MFHLRALSVYLSKQSLRGFRRGFSIFLGGLLLWNFQTASYALHPLLAKKEAFPTGVIQQESETHQLEVAKPIERELAGGQYHTYQITLAANQYLNMVVEQKGVDVVVGLTGPDGKQIIEVDSPNGTKGPEPLTWIVEAPGLYQITVRSLEKGAAIGRYEVRIVELRAATQKDRDLQEADKLIKEFVKLDRAGKFDEARPLIEHVLEIQEKTLGIEHPEVALSINDLASLHMAKGEYAKAESLYLRALSIREKAFGPEHNAVALSLNNLGIVYRDTGNYAKAEVVYKRALAIWEKLNGPEYPRLGATLNNLALVYRDTGEYTKAEPLYQRTLAIWEKAYGSEAPDVALALNNLGLLYRSMGDYVKAESRHQRALAIWEKVRGPESRDVAEALNNLGIIYFTKGDNMRAEIVLQRALAIREKVLGPGHRDVSRTLVNLGSVAFKKGDYAKAEPFYQRALAIQEKLLGPEHPETIGTVVGLALIYFDKGDYAKAEPMFHQVLTATEKVLGPEHPHVAGYLSNLALLYYSKGDLTTAEPLYERALAIREKVLGPDHPDLADSLSAIALLHEAKGEITQAITALSRATAISERNISFNMVVGSERQKFAYLETFSREINHAVSLHVTYAPDDVKALDLALTLVLQRKGRTLDAMTDSLSILRRRSKPEDQALLIRLQDIGTQLAQSVLIGPQNLSPDQYRNRVKDLEEQFEKVQSEVSHRSDEFRIQSQPVKIEDVQSVIPSKTALVEFSSYRPINARYTNPQEAFGARRYIAYIVRQRGEIQWVDLGEADAIDRAVDDWRRFLRAPLQERKTRQLARVVDERVMRPIRKRLGDVRQVLISPDGDLNLIPFPALVDESGHYLVENYSINYLTSGRDLLRLQMTRESKSAPLVLAEPSYGERKDDEANVARPADSDTEDPLAKIYFNPLLTGAEADAIKTLVPDSIVLRRKEATEAAVKTAHAPRILHVATHGFFLQNGDLASANSRGLSLLGLPTTRSGNRTDALIREIENPLLRAGLALAGANQRHSGGDDGILTALEVAGLDLWGTKLVVLSACDTGIGEVKNGEGVYGMRRALVLAGAESQVVSLWKVNDVATKELMVDYYTRLNQGEGRGEALRKVQLKMLHDPRRRHPYYWASFIHSGEWANLEGRR